MYKFSSQHAQTNYIIDMANKRNSSNNNSAVLITEG